MSNRRYILCTTTLEPSLIAKATANKLQVDVQPFITTVAVQDEAVTDQIKQAYHQQSTVIFTSTSAVDAVAKQQPSLPHWTVYCIGNATKELVKEKWNTVVIAGIADNAAALSKLIIAKGTVQAATFFCGDQRRDELPTLLGDAGIALKETEVYKTIAQPVAIENNYDGILFMSPSAVVSYFSVNKPPPETVLFAIGPTTANALKQYSRNTTIISERPGREQLIDLVIDYYKQTIKA